MLTIRNKGQTWQNMEKEEKNYIIKQIKVLYFFPLPEKKQYNEI